MANKERNKYIVLLVVFTVLFFVSILFCIITYRSVAQDYKYNSLSGRLDVIALDEKMYGPDHIFDTLYFDKDYEKEFDSYWEFSDVYCAYIKGRFADDPSEQIEIIQKYIDGSNDKSRKEAASRYLEVIRGK